MVVGEAPGFREDDVGKPFSGKAGQVLVEALEAAGLSRDELYITNAVHCRPPDNRTPTSKEIETCKSYLLGEIEKIKPKFVLVLGSVAMKALLGQTGITKNRGKVIEKDGISYFLCLHPALLFRQPQHTATFNADIARFARISRGEEGTTGKEGFDWSLVHRGNFRQFIASLQAADVISYDLETSGLDQLDPHGAIHVIGFAVEGKQWILPIDYPSKLNQFYGNEKLQKLAISAVKKAMEGKKLVAHNGKFDDKWLKVKFGWAPFETFDTMLASHLLDENTPNGLKYLSQVHFGAHDYGLPQPVPLTTPIRKLGEYCAYDVFYTLKLYHLFRAKLLEDKRLFKIFTKLLMPASRALEIIELRGVYIDPKKYAEALSSISKQVDDMLGELTQYEPKPAQPIFPGMSQRQLKKLTFNWNSTQQVGKLLYGTLKIKAIEKTATGNDSTAESVLLQLRDKHPVVALLLEYRRLIKLKQFLVSWGEHMVDNRLHPNVLLHKQYDEDGGKGGTVTGRLAYQNPNLQQVPRDPFLRSLITAPPGWTFFEIDFSQVELRIAAMISGEVTMRHAFATRQDIHSMTASAVSGIDAGKLTKEERKKAKAVNFGFLYGMGSKKFQTYARDKYDVHLTLAEAEEFRNRFFDLYSGLSSWHDRQRRLVHKYKQVRTPMGRIRHLPDIDSPDKYTRAEAERQAINSPVQGCASDLALFGGTRITEEFDERKVQVVAYIHDAVLGMIKTPLVEKLFPKLIAIMEDTDTVEEVFDTKITVPIVAEGKVGPWGLGKELKKN